MITFPTLALILNRFLLGFVAPFGKELSAWTPVLRNRLL